MSSNRFAGRCECGSWVEANAGIYRGFVFCSEPIFMEDLLRLACPNHVEVIRAEVKAADDRIRSHSTYEPRISNQIDESICAKCDGDGKYRYANGDVGICFSCDGSGKFKERNTKQRRKK